MAVAVLRILTALTSMTTHWRRRRPGTTRAMTALMMRSILSPVVVVAFVSCVATVGCDAGAICDDLAAVSVTATVTDEAGAFVDDAAVAFTVDGGAEQACTFVSGGEYSCGFEVAGAIVVTARKDGFVDAQSGAVDVEAGECHVSGKTVALTLVADDG